MIIWLASYPRSGNTLLRMMLKKVFGVESYSKYNDKKDIGGNEPVKNVVGHLTWGGMWADVYREMSVCEEQIFVKTHDIPDDDAKAIYVVRDGRQACVSYHRYLNHYYDADVTLDSVIAGTAGRFPSWGMHLDAWNPTARPNTLFLTYMDLVSSPQEQLDKISQFCGIDQQLSWENDFEGLHRIDPNFFRSGSSHATNNVLTEQQEDLFWSLHGDWMSVLGFGKEREFVSRAVMRKHFVPHKLIEEQGAIAAKREYTARYEQLVDQLRGMSRSNHELTMQCRELGEHVDALRTTLMKYDEFTNKFSWILRMLPGYPGKQLRNAVTDSTRRPGDQHLSGRDTGSAPGSAIPKRPTRTFQEFFAHIKSMGFFPATIIDVGVARGTPALYEAFPGAYLILVEPVKEFVPHLEAIVKKHGGEFHNCALMSTSGESTIFKTKELHGSSMMHRVSDPTDKRLEKVEVRTLDDVVGSDREAPYLLKTDCQGGDYDVVRGGAEALMKCEVVILEVSFFKFWGNHHPDPLDIIQYMSDHGFVIYDFLDGLFRPRDNALGQIDIVFVKRDGMFRQSHKWMKD